MPKKKNPTPVASTTTPNETPTVHFHTVARPDVDAYDRGVNAQTEAERKVAVDDFVALMLAHINR